MYYANTSSNQFFSSPIFNFYHAYYVFMKLGFCYVTNWSSCCDKLPVYHRLLWFVSLILYLRCWYCSRVFVSHFYWICTHTRCILMDVRTSKISKIRVMLCMCVYTICFVSFVWVGSIYRDWCRWIVEYVAWIGFTVFDFS